MGVYRAGGMGVGMVGMAEVAGAWEIGVEMMELGEGVELWNKPQQRQSTVQRICGTHH